MPSFRRRLTRMLALTSVLLCANASAEGLGLRAPAGDDLWPRWQARVLTAPSFSLWRHAALERTENGRLQPDSLSLLGDYYFGSQPTSREPASGFRATSGLIFGPLGSGALSTFGDPLRSRTRPGGAYATSIEPRGLMPSFDSAPYLGIGYTAAPARSGWGFSADIGVAARNSSSAARFGRVFLGSQSLDDMLRDMRLTPLLNVGVSYSF
ncbi:hypothetical protein [Piscinibacter sakaiensis]|uniref:hypothetical protein n=1 Tax=Piscinibacter sakaiensis TaxID=1547922 RepID=UPI003AAB9C11